MAKEKNQSSTEFARDLVMLVLSAGRILTWQAARGVPAGSLTPTQAQLLEYVFQHPGASLTEVADHLAVRPPTASAMVMRLSAMKLIANADAGIPAGTWMEVTPENVKKYSEILRTSRIAIADKGVYNKQGLKIIKKIRCSVAPGEAECASADES